MYKRETRFKGQKRVSVGRMTWNSDPPESKSKNSSRESSYEDSSKIIKHEPNFNDGSTDVTISGAQVNKLLIVYVEKKNLLVTLLQKFFVNYYMSHNNLNINFIFQKFLCRSIHMRMHMIVKRRMCNNFAEIFFFSTYKIKVTIAKCFYRSA